MASLTDLGSERISLSDISDPFMLAALRQRQAVRPLGGRREGGLSTVAGRVRDGLGIMLSDLAGSPLGTMLSDLATLPQRAVTMAGNLHRFGEYDPAPATDIASLMVGLPFTPRGALGSAAQRPSRRLPMDEASRTARADAMGFRRDVPLEYGRAPEGEKIAAAAIKVNDRVFTGANHADAIKRAEAALGMPFERMRDAPIPDGFFTTAGRYISRWEADEIAQRATQGAATGQFGARYGLVSEGTRMSAAVPRSKIVTGSTAPGLDGGKGLWGWVRPAETAPKGPVSPSVPYPQPAAATGATRSGAIPTGPVWHRTDRPMSMDVQGAKDWQIQKFLEVAWDQGHDAVRLQNYTAPDGRRGDVVVVRDSSQLRDSRARFDPAKRNSRNIMGSILAGGGTALLLTDGASPDSHSGTNGDDDR